MKNSELLELLKLVAEKFLIQGIVATIPTLLVNAYKPNLFNLSDLLTSMGYTLLIWCVCFSVITVIRVVLSKIKEKWNNHKVNKYYKTKRVEENEKVLKRLWYKIDKYYPDEKRLILDFIKSNNTPITSMRLPFCPNLSNDGLVVTTYTKIRKTTTPQSNTNGINLAGASKKYPCGRIFKLKDDIYEILKYSYYRYGKICNFTIDEDSEIYTDEHIW